MLTFLESSCIKGKLDVILQFKKTFFLCKAFVEDVYTEGITICASYFSILQQKY